MIATSHVIIGGAVGIAVGTITKNPAAALTAGFISHLICDAIPHLDGPFNPKLVNNKVDEIIWTRGFLSFAIIDSLIAFFLTLFLWDKFFNLYFFAPLAWGALGAYLPDLIDNFPIWRDKIRKYPGFKQFHALHLTIHELWLYRYPMRHYWPLGIITQIIFVVPCLWYIYS